MLFYAIRSVLWLYMHAGLQTCMQGFKQHNQRCCTAGAKLHSCCSPVCCFDCTRGALDEAIHQWLQWAWRHAVKSLRAAAGSVVGLHRSICNILHADLGCLSCARARYVIGSILTIRDWHDDLPRSAVCSVWAKNRKLRLPKGTERLSAKPSPTGLYRLTEWSQGFRETLKCWTVIYRKLTHTYKNT